MLSIPCVTIAFQCFQLAILGKLQGDDMVVSLTNEHNYSSKLWNFPSQNVFLPVESWVFPRVFLWSHAKIRSMIDKNSTGRFL